MWRGIARLTTAVLIGGIRSAQTHLEGVRQTETCQEAACDQDLSRQGRLTAEGIGHCHGFPDALRPGPTMKPHWFAQQSRTSERPLP